MLVTIKNGKRTLKITKRERDTLEAAHGIISEAARDFADDENDQKSRFESASHTICELASFYAETPKAVAGRA